MNMNPDWLLRVWGGRKHSDIKWKYVRMRPKKRNAKAAGKWVSYLERCEFLCASKIVNKLPLSCGCVCESVRNQYWLRLRWHVQIAFRLISVEAQSWESDSLLQRSKKREKIIAFHNDSPVTGIAGSNNVKELQASKVNLKRYRVALFYFNTCVFKMPRKTEKISTWISMYNSGQKWCLIIRY